MKRYSLLALGMVNALGVSLPEISERLFAEQGNYLTPHRLRTTGAIVPVGQVSSPLSQVPHGLEAFQCRNHALAFMAFRQIASAIERQCQLWGASRIGVLIGSSVSGIEASESAFFKWRDEGKLPDQYSFRHQHEMGSISEFVARLAGAKGPAYTLSTACTSSAKVFASAQALLDSSICDCVVLGGVDSLCHLTLNGFEALEALSRDVSNPMSRRRSGLNIGEGAALFVLSREAGPICLAAVGESSDAHHISAPDPDGLGAERAIRAAMAQAGLEPGEIDYLNLHGTGTTQNDSMEARAVARVFGNVPSSSTKPLVGHCLGASGAVEAGFCWLALDAHSRGRVPLLPHRWDGEFDPALPPLNLVRAGALLSKEGPIRFLSNSFAFGGSNCALILERSDAPIEPVHPKPVSTQLLHLHGWSGWAPGLSSRAHWLSWLQRPEPIQDNGELPPCKNLPPLLRRRCGLLVRMVLEAAFDACKSGQIDPARVHHIHCSRHGEIRAMRQIFDSLWAKQPLSPTLFSNSLHQTPSAYFDMASANTLLSRTLSGDESGLASALLEVLGLLRQEPDVPILLTFGDEATPKPFDTEEGACSTPHAIAFVFSSKASPDSQRLSFRRENSQGKKPGHVFDFLRWLSSSESNFHIAGNFGELVCQR